MRAHIITTTTRPRRSARRVLPLVLGICALAIPATASASPQYSSVNSITGGSSERTATELGQAVGEPGDGFQTSVSAITGGSSESSSENPGGSPAADSGYSSLNATAGPPASQPTVLAGSPADPAEGFDWASAGVGAGAAMALAALSGAAFLTVRRRTAVSPSGASMS